MIIFWEVTSLIISIEDEKYAVKAIFYFVYIIYEIYKIWKQR